MKDSHDDVLVEFLSEFASHLLNCGITMSEFRIAAQAAFIQAALSSARLQNSRINQSAVAAVTGLSRAQVRALLRNPPDPTSSLVSQRVNAVVSGWRSDPSFIDEDGLPVPLSIAAGRRSFPALIKKYGRDVSYRALLSEMKRMGYVRQVGQSVHLQKDRELSKQMAMTQLLSQGLTHIIRRTSHEAPKVLSVISGEAAYDTPDEPSRLLLQRRLVQGTRAFAADIQAAADAATSRGGGKPNGHKVRTRILVVTVD